MKLLFVWLVSLFIRKKCVIRVKLVNLFYHIFCEEFYFCNFNINTISNLPFYLFILSFSRLNQKSFLLGHSIGIRYS